MVYTIDFLKEVQDYINGYRDLSIAEITQLVREEFVIDITIDEVETLYFCKIPSSVEELLEGLKIGMSRGELKMLELITEKLPPIYECRECGRYYPHIEATPFEYRGALFCPSCYEAYFRECYECGTLIYEYDATRDAYGDHYCPDCAYEHLLYCDECGEYHRRDNIIFDAFSNYMCQDCFESYFYICEDCGGFVHHDCVYWIDDTLYCEECYHNNSYIHEYGYKPYPIFHGEGNRLLGVELEVDRGGYNQSVAREVIDILGDDFVYCKYDGSLDDGFEIVSHPATLDYHMQSMNWGEVLDYLRDEGYESHDAGTCGLHIHMNRKGFGDTEEEQELGISKVLFFIERHWDKVVKFSRRTPSQLDEWAARYLCSSPEHPEDVLEYAKNDMSRYRAVNLCPCHTIEIRVFRGSLVYETFMATLQFCDLLYDIAELSLEEVMDITWNEFKEMGSKYKEFTSYLERRGL